MGDAILSFLIVPVVYVPALRAPAAYTTFLPGAADCCAGFAVVGIANANAIPEKQKDTCDFNIVFILGKTMPAPGLDYFGQKSDIG